jgi:hypothetical protein
MEITVTLTLTEREISQLADFLESIGRWTLAAQIRSDQERRRSGDA